MTVPSTGKGDAKQRIPICSWCGTPLLSDQPTCIEDGERLHLICAVEIEESADLNDGDFR